MAGVGSFFGKFFGRTIGDAASFAIGGAVSRTIDPELQVVANESWRAAVSAGATVPLDAGDAAEIVAEGVGLQAWGQDQAAQGGLGGDQFAALVQAVLNAPGVPELLTLWRRGEISDDDFGHGLRKSRLEQRWDSGLRALKAAKLTPQVLALGIVRSVVKDPGLLAVTLDTSDSNVAQYPVYPGDALEEAAAAGISRDQLRVMVGEVGLPMAAIGAAQAFFKGILTRGAYYQAILEGDTRPEWADTILDNARQLPTAHDFVEKRLRGWTDDAGMYAGTARHGMSEPDTDTLFLISGRPISAHQIFIGILRGGVYDGPTDHIDPHWLKGAQESNIRPEWYNILWAGRYSFPPLFQLNNLVKAGAVPPDTAAQWATWEGQAPEVVTVLTAYWQSVFPTGKAAAAKPDPAISAARAAAVTAIRKAYVGGGISALTAAQDLADLGVSEAAQAKVITDWDVEAAIPGQEADTAGGTPH